MSISGGMDYYLIQIKLGHAGDMGDEDLLPRVTPIESLFDSNKFNAEVGGVAPSSLTLLT